MGINSPHYVGVDWLSNGGQLQQKYESRIGHGPCSFVRRGAHRLLRIAPEGEHRAYVLAFDVKHRDTGSRLMSSANAASSVWTRFSRFLHDEICILVEIPLLHLTWDPRLSWEWPSCLLRPASKALSSMIFRQTTEFRPKFSNPVVNCEGFQNTLDFILTWTFVIGQTIFWSAWSLILSKFWSSWVYCWTTWSLQRKSS